MDGEGDRAEPEAFSERGLGWHSEGAGQAPVRQSDFSGVVPDGRGPVAVARRGDGRTELPSALRCLGESESITPLGLLEKAVAPGGPGFHELRGGRKHVKRISEGVSEEASDSPES